MAIKKLSLFLYDTFLYFGVAHHHVQDRPFQYSGGRVGSGYKQLQHH